MFKVCGIVRISKIEFFTFPGTERIKQTKKNKSHLKPPKLVIQSLFKKFQQNRNILLGFYWTLLFPVPCWANANTKRHSNSNISKMVKANTFFKWTFFKEYLIAFLMISRLINFVLVVLSLLMFKVRGIIGIFKIEFFKFNGTKRVTQNKKIKAIWNLLNLQLYYFSSNSNKSRTFCWFFNENITLPLTVPSWAGANTALHSNSNFSK